MTRKRIPTYVPTLTYLRVSTDEQAESGAGLGAQRAAIENYATRAGLTVDAWHVDAGVSGSVVPAQRPALAEALAVLSSARSGVLLVAKSDRIARSAADLLNLCALAEREGWSLVAADGTVDQTTPHGKFMTTVMAGVAELERDHVRARTRDALAAKRASGVRLGRPVMLPQAIRERIAAERAEGATLARIASGLNEDKVQTVRGGAQWHPSTVASALRSLDLDAQARAARARHDQD